MAVNSSTEGDLISFFDNLDTKRGEAPSKTGRVYSVLDDSISTDGNHILASPLKPQPYLPPTPKQPPRKKRQTKNTKPDPFHPSQPNRTTLFELNAAGVVEEDRGKRTITWRFLGGFETSRVSQMMEQLTKAVKTMHRIRCTFGYKLRHIETGDVLLYFMPPQSSLWFEEFSQMQAWLQKGKENRLQGGNIERPNTNFSFDGTIMVLIKAILDQQPLRIGVGLSPDGLRNKN